MQMNIYSVTEKNMTLIKVEDISNIGFVWRETAVYTEIEEMFQVITRLFFNVCLLRLSVTVDDISVTHGREHNSMF